MALRFSRFLAASGETGQRVRDYLVGERMQCTVLVVWRHGRVGQEREDWFPVRLLGMPDIEYDERAGTPAAARRTLHAPPAPGRLEPGVLRGRPAAELRDGLHRQ